jgi:heme exporter protein A
MLEIQNVSKSFFMRPVLKNVSLKVEDGDSVGIAGANGAGKTTLLRTLARISACDSGDILLDGESLLKGKPNVRAGVLFISHHPNLYPVLTGEENLLLTARLYGQTKSAAEISSALEEVGLSRFRWDPIRNYSRGMLQRLGLAKTLIVPWKLLLLDEPTTGLDEDGSRLIEQFLLRWRKEGRSMIIVSHDIGWLEIYCNVIYSLSGGVLKNYNESEG